MPTDSDKLVTALLNMLAVMPTSDLANDYTSEKDAIANDYTSEKDAIAKGIMSLGRRIRLLESKQSPTERRCSNPTCDGIACSMSDRCHLCIAQGL